MAAIAVIALLVVSAGVIASRVTPDDASSPALARVDGLEYAVAAARSLRVPVEELIPFVDTVAVAPQFEFDSKAAYAIKGVDPKEILVMKLVPGQHDDAGSLGDYVLLMRGSVGLICAYFDPASEATPTDCR